MKGKAADMVAMRELSDMGARVIVAMLAGAGLVGLAMLASGLLPPGGLPDALGGWPLLAALAALLCGACALGMSGGLRWSSRRAAQVARAGLLASAIAWGVCVSVATKPSRWSYLTRGWFSLTHAVISLVAAIGGASPIPWLLLYAALVGLLAGLQSESSDIRRALTPLWLTPLWGAGVGVVYGLLYAAVYSIPPCPPGFHCYGIYTTRWDGLGAGLALGVGGGLILGLALALTLRLALALRPIWQDSEPLAQHSLADGSET